MLDHKIQIPVQGKLIDTLEDILPEEGKPLKILFIAKVPTPGSVANGHYFQGNQGKAFWRMLKEYGILNVPKGEFEDDYLLENNFGMIDIVKVPRRYGKEPYADEYKSGAQRVQDVINKHKPKLIIFVYKNVIDKLMWHLFRKSYSSLYGFNPEAESYFGCKVFGFPLSGTPCKIHEIQKHMNELNAYLNEIG